MTFWIAISTIAGFAQTVSSLYTDHQTRKAAAAPSVLPRTVHIPSNAFNAGADFTNLYAGTAIGGVALLAMTVDQLGKLGKQLSGIKDELEVQTAAIVQGWHEKGFGSFIYDFAKTEIDEYDGDASVGKHAFYIYNPTTSAEIVFKQKVKEQPLPSSFGGISDDIEAIFRLMWANRQALRATMTREEADKVAFHLLVPAKRTWAMVDPLVIDESIGRLTIKGHMDEGSCYASFNFGRLPPQVSLHHVGHVTIEDGNIFLVPWLGGVGSWFGGAASTILFPPAAPFFAAGFMLCWVGCVGGGLYNACKPRQPARLLGPP